LFNDEEFALDTTEPIFGGSNLNSKKEMENFQENENLYILVYAYAHSVA
jgi:hypothetical protein